MATAEPKPEILDTRKAEALNSPLGKITLRQYEMLKGGTVIVQSILQEQNVEIENSTKVTHNRSFPSEGATIPKLKERLDKDWKSAQEKLKMVREEAKAYTLFKTRGKGNEMFSYEAASNALYECIEKISAGTLSKEECHHSMRNVLHGHHVLREASTKMDKVEDEMALAHEAIDHIRHMVKQALKGADRPEFEGDFDTQKLEDAQHHCTLFASALSDALDNTDKVWWMQANNISNGAPMPSREKAWLIENIRNSSAQAKQEYNRLLTTLEGIGLEDEAAEIQKIVEDRSEAGGGVVQALDVIMGIVTRDDLLRDTVSSGRVREKNK